ncbi:putative bifunctional diguanylate cyclase/phosphodiesterase [Cryptosporangium phraense]|uniref:putative bifunctional diguanylate cyclase/phosphodiesterase n=1 Tax=Cryptosporangium phraense TaxID=2593070 RepID=UPI00197AB48F|nr:bifunctional diguanylate cyclase/phosphodiesterase [Cryptosporangium phraense]
MTDARLLRRTPRSLLAAGGLVIFDVLWLIGGLFHRPEHPLPGWLPLPVLVALAGQACWQAGLSPQLDPASRRFWQQLTVACGLFGAGTVANAFDALGGPTPSQRIGPISLAFYLSVLGIVLWALLRLPSWYRTRGDWIRFGLDACMVLITAAALVWHLSLRDHRDWIAQTGSAGAMLAIIVVALISVATFVKVAFAGAGLLDRRAMQILAVGSAASASLGGLSPLLVSRPYLSTSMVAIPVAAFSLHLAAARQLRAARSSSVQRRRSWRISLVPYLAVAVTGALLLTTSTSQPTETAIMQALTVLLALVVVLRQVLALRDNNQLLATVDGQLEDLRRYQNQLEHQATHDSLTGVANRALLERHLRRLLADQQSFSLVLLDIDDFKAINDRLGHGAGDRLLRLVSNRLTDAIGPSGIVARLGGDEFALLLDAAADLETVTDSISFAIREPIDLAGMTASIATSIGISTRCTGDSAEELLRRADVALYAAKAAGGDCRRWFDPEMDHAAEEASNLSADLRRALLDGQIFVLYQPIVDLHTNATIGAEVLIRWQHPQRGLVPPDVFIPLAERNGTILELGAWVLRAACRQVRQWQHRYGDQAPTKISVNVSARQLAQPDFAEQVASILAETAVDPSTLILEVTETAVLSTDAALPQIARIKQLGLRVALDDFGTGHSSLSLLLACPVDALKVDRSFVSGVHAEGAGAIITRNLIGFIEDFGIEAVAEGVETVIQADRLRQAGYRFAQGYLFGRPMPAADLEQRFVSPAPSIIA